MNDAMEFGPHWDLMFPPRTREMNSLPLRPRRGQAVQKEGRCRASSRRKRTTSSRWQSSPMGKGAFSPGASVQLS